MKENTITQFVCFDTTLDSEAFVLHWAQGNNPACSEALVIQQQQVVKNGRFQYISQHQYTVDQFHFVFKNKRRSSKFPEVEIRTKQIGGYSAVQLEQENDTEAGETKVFVFISDPDINLDRFRRLSVPGNLNIYEAYYENCAFTHILELFVKEEHAGDMTLLLESLAPFAATGIYKECLVHA